MVPSRLLSRAKPLLVKGRVAGQVKHISAPLKGLSLSSKLAPSDQLTALVLDNFTVEENLIRCRPGTRLTRDLGTGQPVEQLVPYYGLPNRLAGASAGKLILLDGTEIGTGFLRNDWSWTSFSNLSSTDYTVMVNGIDGVWSWNGGVTPADVVKETVTAPASETWVVPDQFNIVLGHMNRLFFADSSNLAIYYLPLQAKSGEVAVLPLNAVFKRGGQIAAMYTWTTDSAFNINDQLVIFTTNGECAIYTGVDPASDFFLSGLYRFDAPMSKHSVVNYGGELWVMTSTGLMPMSRLMQVETGSVAQDENVVSDFFKASLAYRDRPGWSVFINPSSARIYCNTPQGAPNNYRQIVRSMHREIWSTWSSIPSRCWGWVDARVFFGTDLGKVYEIHPSFLNDDGLPIRVDVQTAWSNFGTPAFKQFKKVKAYIQCDGTPRPYIDVKTDYDMTPPTNQPDVTFADVGSDWDLEDWDEADWSGDLLQVQNWTGVTGNGEVGAPRLVALINNAQFTVSGFGVLYETGSIFG